MQHDHYGQGTSHIFPTGVLITHTDGLTDLVLSFFGELVVASAALC